jgi:hypothetical protein
MIISISAKCSDMFSLSCEAGEYSGYVPACFPGDHFGDYVELDIDTKTGQIKNWKPISDQKIKELIGS